MGSANTTSFLGLPIFGDGDKPTWRGDMNGAFTDIDVAVKGIDARVGKAEGHISTVAVYVSDFGPLGTADDTVTVQKALDAANGRRVVFPPNTTVKVSNVIVRNLSNAIIDGNGCTLQLLAKGTRGGIQLDGTLDNVVIENFRIVGNAVIADAHAGIWMNSGPVVKALTIRNNVIRDTTLGISVNADLAGTIDGALIIGNDLDNIVGTLPGNGYGIHHASGTALPTNTRIVNNTIRRAQRHSVYVAKGDGVVLTGNQIINHRLGVTEGVVRAAITVLRSTNVTITGNYVTGAVGGSVNLACDTGNTAGLDVTGNTFVDPGDAFPVVTIGDALLAFSPSDVSLVGNIIRSNVSGARLIKVYCALGLLVASNRMSMDNPTGSTAVEIVGQGDTAGTATWSDRLTFIGNTIRLNGAATYRGFRFSGVESTAVKMRFDSNVIIGAGTEFIAGVNMTNPNVSFMNHALTGLSYNAGIRPAPVPGSPLALLQNITSPTDTPVAGGYLYVESGSLKYKGTNGTVTTIAPA